MLRIPKVMTQVGKGRLLAGALGLALLVAACSSGDDTSSVEGTDTSIGAVAVTSEAPTSLPPVTRPEYVPEAEDGRPFLELTLDEKIEEFKTSPNSIFAANIAAEMGLSGEQRYGPWLLDIQRVVSSTETDLTVTRALQDLSGIPAIGSAVADFVQYGSWSRSNSIDPGEGYESFKLAAYATIQDEYAVWLDGVDDPQVLGAISWGGVRRGGIPELNDNPRISAAEADFMTPDELVLGVVINDVAVAYPLRFLARHELANDHIDGIPVSLVYCTLCRTGLLFDRRVEGQIIDFQTSGLLIDSNKIMIDNQTETLWHHLRGLGISGPLKGVELEQFPIQTVRWSEWLAEHPDTETLETPAATFLDPPEREPIVYDYTPGEAYSGYYEGGSVWFPIIDAPDIFEDQAGVITLQLPEGDLALELASVEGESPFVVEVSGHAVVVVPNVGGARIFDAGETDLAEGDPVVVANFTPAMATLEDGTELGRLVSGQSFWFAWWGVHQETEIWPRS